MAKMANMAQMAFTKKWLMGFFFKYHHRIPRAKYCQKHHEKPQYSQNNGSGLRIPLWSTITASEKQLTSYSSIPTARILDEMPN